MIKRSLIQFHGSLPKHLKGNNIGRINREATAKKYNITVDLLFKAYWNWQHIFRIETSTLTFENYLDKMINAGLTPIDIGNAEGQYNLSRYGDDGPYTNDNCRFITRKQNLAEQQH